MHGAMIFCKTSFIVVLWSLPCYSLLFCLKVVCKYNWYCCCHFTILCIVENSNKQPISNEYLFLNTPYPFCYVSFPFLVFVLQLLSFWYSKAKFNVSSPMLLLFIYNFFRFHWWHCDSFATFNIVTSFINNLFQMSSSLSFCFCWSFFLLFYKTKTTNEKCEIQYLHFSTNHNL